MSRPVDRARSVPPSLSRSAWSLGCLLAALLLASPAVLAEGPVDQIVLSRPWARLRSEPAEASRAIAIVYGNDVLGVLERKDGWVKVETANRVRGWLSPQDAGSAPPAAQTAPSAAAEPAQNGAVAPIRGGNAARPGSSIALPSLPARNTNPASPDSLRRMGYEEAARRMLTETLLSERDTSAAYRATRDMLTYHPVGDLPPLQGARIPEDLRDEARRLRVSVLLEEGRALVREGKPWDAILLYQSLVQSEPDNGRAYLELLDLLTQYMQASAQSPAMENLGMAISIYRKAYPDLALPPAVEARMGDSKK
ncbi:MAG: SH3 domain-containing protein [SAR324 cluster bacterium]